VEIHGFLAGITQLPYGIAIAWKGHGIKPFGAVRDLETLDSETFRYPEPSNDFGINIGQTTFKAVFPGIWPLVSKHNKKVFLRNTLQRKEREMKKFFMLGLALSLALIAASAQAQVTTGSVRGTVVDPNGAVVSGAKVIITRKSTSEAKEAMTSDSGVFHFDQLQPGSDYSITVEAANFKKAEINDVTVQLGQTNDTSVQLQTGQLTETVTVSAGGAELVNTTTADLSKGFDSRTVVELGQTSVGFAGVNNLALIAPNVSSSGGVGVGTGGSVGGQRPRNNNFMLDGIDNNDKSVTGPQSYISPEEVAEFSLLQNQFSSEFGRSNGGQFVTVTKSGTNDYHGSVYTFWRNRYLNALDTLQKVAGVNRDKNSPNFMPRYDYFRGGFNLGGPVNIPNFTGEDKMFWSGKDKLFFFMSYERLQTGSAIAAGGITSPTAAGFATLAALPGVRPINLGVLQTYMPAAPSNNAGTIQVCAINVVNHDCPLASLVNVPVGSITFPAPNFNKQNHWVGNIDYNHSSNTQMRFRFTMTNVADIDNSAFLPVFFIAIPTKQRLFSATFLHNFSTNLTNETRIAFRRSSLNLPVPDILFPGLTTFPNIGLNDLGVDIGPDPNAPQGGVENNYQIVNNVTYLAGNHSLKFGGDFRILISPQTFSQRVRGDYQYLATDSFLRDFSPEFGERNAGNNVYYGNQKILYAFLQDDWRVKPNLTLNLGVNYSYQEVPLGARTSQALNSISTVPGLIEFRAPKSQKKNFAPKVGFAWSPNFGDGLLAGIFGASGKSSIRAGFSMGYDYIFDNLYILSNPPQLQQTNDVGGEGAFTNFLANGGLPDTPVAITSAAVARANTGSFIPDQEVPYSLTWTLSWQRQFKNDWSVEARYLGTRGVHLLTQNRISNQARVSPESGRPGLPTFLSAPTQAQLDALSLTLASIQARSGTVPAYAAAGFGPNVVAFLSNGNSTYHGASGQLQKRFSKGLQMTAAYTWSHLIDDTTAEVFSTVLTPRRVEDFQNLRRERADSALDRRHRFVTAWIYELPWFRNEKGLAATLLGGFNIAGTYTAESGEKVTVRSGNDANLNGDSAGDRAILNPSGQEGIGSAVTALRRTDGQTVGYLALNPNARYIQAGNGAQSNIARNTFLMPGINNFDISIFKNFRFGEGRKRIQIRADFFNAFNHPQFTAGSVNTVDPVATTGQTQYVQITPVTPDFLKADRVFSSNPRVIQAALRFDW
jgi:Carboxypeptidase regulatory-like domain